MNDHTDKQHETGKPGDSGKTQPNEKKNDDGSSSPPPKRKFRGNDRDQ